MRLALEARSWVKGPDLGVGACVVSPDRRGFSLGYSGLPKGIQDNDKRITDPAFKDFNMVHAELNAILNAGRNLEGWSLYSTTCPCSNCAAAIIQAGIKTVIAPPPQTHSRWFQSQAFGASMLKEARVEIRRCEADEQQQSP